ncbi:cellulose binding domain-containing protein [Acetivibrio cellulolyticus]|uniref:cellulose binding domain-containing protein n=1 Tax=Acetivibrio cellulolyticus TaxID=35830 RepID=UPI0001E304B3|nr:cellulose binding domain-containing protein [Acetivibrio cellulolyticus]
MNKKSMVKKTLGIVLTTLMLLGLILNPSAGVNVLSAPKDDLKVEFFNQVKTSTTNSIAPRFKLSNTGTSAIVLSEITLKYYYTNEEEKAQIFFCDWTTVGNSNVTGIFEQIIPAVTGADCSLKIGFTSGAGSLMPGQSIEVQTRFSKSDWSNYNQSDDYSFNITSSNYSEWNKVTAFYQNTLIKGSEPFVSVTPTSTPTLASTPTSTLTLTPKSTPTPTPIATDNNDLKVEFFNQVKTSATNSIAPRFKLSNTGTSAIVLSDITLKYYYTNEEKKAQIFFCDWTTVGNSNVTGIFEQIIPAVNGADCSLKIGFTSGAGSLMPGQSIEVQTRFSKSDWSNYNQSDDYSFNSTSSSYSEWNKVTAFYQNALIKGTEPFVSVTPTPTLTPKSTPTPAPIATDYNNLKVESYNVDIGSLSQQITTQYRITNTGTSIAKLSKIKLKYYYTNKDNSSQTFNCNMSSVGLINVTGTVENIQPALTDVNCILTVGFTEAAGNLIPGENIVVRTMLKRGDRLQYQQWDDYSFNSTAANYTNWDKITMFYNDKKISGQEPVGLPSLTPSPTPSNITTPTVTPTPTPIMVDFSCGIGECWKELHYAGVMGKPIDVSRDFYNGTRPGKFQQFPEGFIVYSNATGAVFISNRAFNKWSIAGGMTTTDNRNMYIAMGFPKEHSQNDSGIEYTEFEGGTIINVVAQDKQYILFGKNAVCYNNQLQDINGLTIKDKLGLPIADEVLIPSTGEPGSVSRSYQNFEHGAIFYIEGSANNAIAIWGKTYETYISTDPSMMYVGFPLESPQDIIKDSKVFYQKCLFENFAMYYDMVNEPYFMDFRISNVYEANGGVLGWMGLAKAPEGITAKGTKYLYFANGIIVANGLGTAAFKDLSICVDSYTAYGSDGAAGANDLYVNGSIKGSDGHVTNIHQPYAQGRETIVVNKNYLITSSLTHDYSVDVYLEGKDADDTSPDDDKGVIEKKYDIENLWGYFENPSKRKNNFEAVYRFDSVSIPYSLSNFRRSVFWSFSNFSTSRLSPDQYADTFADVDHDESWYWHPFNSTFYHQVYKTNAASGNCFGICLEAIDALSGNSMYTEPLFSKYFSDTLDGRDLTAIDDAHKGLINEINIKQAYQIGSKSINSVFTEYFDRGLSNPGYTFEDTYEAFKKGNYCIVNISKDGVLDSGGHWVLPYRWETDNPKYPGKWLMYVADPNKPAGLKGTDNKGVIHDYTSDESSIIFIDPIKDTYEYEMPSGEKWHGRFYALDYSILRNPQNLPFNSICSYIGNYVNMNIYGAVSLYRGDIPLVNYFGGSLDNGVQTGDTGYYFGKGKGQIYFDLETKDIDDRSQIALETSAFSSEITLYGKGKDNISLLNINGYSNHYTDFNNDTRGIIVYNYSDSSDQKVDISLQAVNKQRWIKLENVSLKASGRFSINVINGGKSLDVEYYGNGSTQCKLIYKEDGNSEIKEIENVWLNPGNNRISIDGKVVVPEPPRQRQTTEDMNGILAYWKFNDFDNVLAKDSSGNNNLLDTSSTYNENGVSGSGKAISLNGVNQYAFMANKEDFNFDSNESFSISTWVNVKDPESTKLQSVFSKGSPATSSNWFGIWINNKKWYFGGKVGLSGTSNVLKGWNHVAVVQDGSANMRYLYVNGVLEATGNAMNGASVEDIRVGGSTAGNDFLNGCVDEMYVRSYPLSQSDITKEYKRYHEGVLARWNFNETSGTTVKDEMGNYDGILKTDSDCENNWSGKGYIKLNPYYRDHVVIPNDKCFYFDRDDSYMIFARVYIPEPIETFQQGIFSKGRSTSVWKNYANCWEIGSTSSRIDPWGSATLSPGWHDIALKQNGPYKNRELFIDNIKILTTSSINDISDFNYDMIIGAISDYDCSSYGFFNGYIDYVEVCNYSDQLVIQ